MKDFYEAKRELVANVQREFTFAGVRFELLPVMPGDAYSDWAELGSTQFAGNIYDVMVDVVRRSLRPEFRDKWNKVLAQDRDVPISIDVIVDLVAALITEEDEIVEKMTGRPLASSSPSTNTPGNTTTPSTDDSASRAVNRSTPLTSVPV